MLGVFILLTAATASSAAGPLLDATTLRSPDDFGSCFTRAEERDGRAWAYLPTVRGGTFTDSGARGVPASYWLQVRRAGGSTGLRLYAARGQDQSARVVQGVNRCR